MTSVLSVLIDAPLTKADLGELLQIPGIDVRFAPPDTKDEPRPLPRDLIADVQVLVCSFPPTNLDDMRQLRLIQLVSTGYNQLFGLRLPERNIIASNSRGVFDVSIAEWNIAMMINLARDLPDMLRNQQRAVWRREVRYEREIRDSVVGLWGYGGIGRETARLAKHMGLTVHVLARSGRIAPRTNIYCIAGAGDPQGRLPDRVFAANEAHAFLGGVDFLILSLPLTNITRGIVGEAELKAMKPSAFLLNPARGHLVQEEALMNALRSGGIAGAAIDTHYHYPLPSDHPLWAMPNVILTPHVSGSSGGPFFARRLAQILTENVKRFIARQPLLNELTRRELEGQ
jgi:phosphoglycerate dehydrogenase-like enzyme